MKATNGRLLRVGLLALAAVVGFDLFLHAGLLAPLYAGTSAFILPPDQAFQRIPFGYVAFALLTTLQVWLMSRMDVRGWRRGLGFGLMLGVLVWCAETLGLYSVTTASPSLLLGWFLGQSAEMGIAGMIIGAGLGRDRLRPLLMRVLLFALIMVVLSIVLQNIRNFTAS